MASELSVHAVYLDGMRVLAETGNHQVLTDYPLPAGRPVEGLTSLELLLASLATCAANSVLALLKRKLNQPVTGLEVNARGSRREEHPTVLSEISLEFIVKGAVDPEAVKKSLKISEDQLCPVWNMLKSGTPITATYRIAP
ncbi:MAG: OsmC family protein [Terracidiphilus sp.]|nr:OsmC family protein [Terracidiphilus sp.]MDR3798325.1 OsmC family protein [Terracidiphilus sp.]